MTLAFNVAALAVVALVVAALVAVPVAGRREKRAGRAETARRDAGDSAVRDFAATVRAGYVTRSEPVRRTNPPGEGS